MAPEHDKEMTIGVEETASLDTAHGSPPRATTPLSCLRKALDALLNRWWLWEVASLAVSVLAMIAVIIILLRVNNMALVDWTFPIQPNSMVSVFMTISKSALLVPIAECISQSKWFQFHQAPRTLHTLQEFDEASRGPWGSTQLLFVPSAAGWVAWSGALLTVASLALDPFTQQILAFPTRRVPSSRETAQVLMTQSLEKVSKPIIQGAVLSSLYNPPKPPITYTCTSSSCRWDKSVSSLGVCSTCRNLTDVIKPVCSTVPGPLFPAAPTESWSFATTTCNYTINPKITSSVYLQTLTLPAADGREAEYASQYTQIRLLAPPPGQGLGDLIFPSDSEEDKQKKNIRWISTIFSHTTYFDKDRRRMPQGNLTISDLAPELSVCGLYFCAQAYSGLSVANNSLVVESTEPAISNPLYFVPDKNGKPELVPLPPGSSPSGALNSQANGQDPDYDADENQPQREYAEALFLSDEDNLAFPYDYRPTANTTTRPRSEKKMFRVTQQAVFNLQGTLREVFALTQSSGNDVFDVFPEANSGMDGLSTSVYKNITDAIERVAESVTRQIRIAEGSHVVDGLAMVDETFVLVRWEWMTLPLAVLACVVVLLGATILRSGKEGGMGIWKSSSLALLVHPLLSPKGVEMDGVRVESLEKMKQFASRVKVRLEGVGKERGKGRLGFAFVGSSGREEEEHGK